jgi:hypothetical protein
MRVVGVVMKISLNKLRDYPKVMPYDQFLGAYHEQLPEWEAMIKALEEARVIFEAVVRARETLKPSEEEYKGDIFTQWLERFVE